MTVTSSGMSGFRRLTAIWLFAVALMVMMLVAFQGYLEREQLLDTLVSEASAIGGNAGAALVFNDESAATEMLWTFRNQEVVLEARLYRNDGSRLADYRGPRPGAGLALAERAPPSGHEFSWRELRLAQPILLDGRPVGSIALRASLDGVFAEVLRFVAGLAAIACFAGAFAYFATNRLRRRLAEKEAARRQAEAELAQSRDQLRQMIARREQVLEEEHKRIAMEIHDQLGQLLTAAMLNLRSLERGLGPIGKDARDQIEEIQAELNESYYGMKNIATLLHPAVLKFGFPAAVEWLAGRLLKVAGVRWRIDVASPPPPLGQEQSMGLFRIVQEALVNVVRHARAANVRISLEAADGTLALEVADDGCGFDPGAGGAGITFGLIGMRERAESLGGRVTISGGPRGGTRVRVELPLVAPEAPAVGAK